MDNFGRLLVHLLACEETADSEQALDRDAQGVGKALDVVDGDVACFAFYVGNEGAVQAGLKGETFLTKPLLAPELNEIQSQEFARRARKAGT